MLIKGLKLQCLDHVSITQLRQMMKIGQFCFFHEHDIWKTKKKKKKHDSLPVHAAIKVQD